MEEQPSKWKSCVICWDTFLEQSMFYAWTQQTFEKFCNNILNVKDEGGQRNLLRLHGFSSDFSFCPECLVLIRKAIQTKSIAMKLQRWVDVLQQKEIIEMEKGPTKEPGSEDDAGVEESHLRTLQLKILSAVKEFQRRMVWFYIDMKMIADVVSNCQFVPGEDGVTMLRKKILEVVKSLALHKEQGKLLNYDREDGSGSGGTYSPSQKTNWTSPDMGVAKEGWEECSNQVTEEMPMTVDTSPMSGVSPTTSGIEPHTTNNAESWSCDKNRTTHDEQIKNIKSVYQRRRQTTVKKREPNYSKPIVEKQMNEDVETPKRILRSRDSMPGIGLYMDFDFDDYDEGVFEQ